jgi:hypothetical protein
MRLNGLIDQNWKKWERERFLKASTKTETDAFDPEGLKHDGFDDREEYVSTHVPGLADEKRIRAELATLTPPRLDEMNDSPYQSLVLRYGILQVLIRQARYRMEKDELLDAVQQWQQELLDEYSDRDFGEGDLLYLARAAVQYQMDIDDSELNMVRSYCEVRNEDVEWKHEQFTWQDFFQRLASIQRFPKVSRSDRPSHALDTIEKGVWSLQEQALVYEISTDDGDIVGIPEEYIPEIRDWLAYEMSDENFLTMLETLAVFDQQSVLIEASDRFGIDKKNHGKNEKRRENIVEVGVYPSDLLREVVTKDQLKEIVDQYGLDAHKRRTDEMIQATISYFERSQKQVEQGDPTADIYLNAYEEIADGEIQQVPPQLQRVVDEDDPSSKLDVLFEKATGEIFEEVFNLDSTTLLGQQSEGMVPDGEIEQEDTWLLWDNKRRTKSFRLGGSAQHKIVNYIERKQQQHTVEWFILIAPGFGPNAGTNAIQLEKQVGVDIRLLVADDLKELALMWQDSFGDDEELPLSIFYGSGEFNLEASKAAIEQQFS